MGSTSSVSFSKVLNLFNSEDEAKLIAQIMPVYYTTDELTTDELDEALKAWKMIVNDTSDNFHLRKQFDGQCTQETCSDYFSHTFHSRLFETLPTSQKIFIKPLEVHGMILIHQISDAFEYVNDEETWNKTFENLATYHNKIGVKATEYGVVGQLLLMTIRKCVGPTIYNEFMHGAWVKIYSKMLKVIIPNVVKFERNNKKLVENLYNKRIEQNKLLESPDISDILRIFDESPAKLKISAVFSANSKNLKSFHDLSKRSLTPPIDEEHEENLKSCQSGINSKYNSVHELSDKIKNVKSVIETREPEKA